ncbi:MAG: hypothetical protein PVJ57_02100 [Phycisphaerae bacterium]
MSRPPPSFDEWVEYCFTQGHADSSVESGAPGYGEIMTRWSRFTDFEMRVLPEYITRLFRSPAFLADRYSDDQIGDGTWFLLGVESEYFLKLWFLPVGPDIQIECMSSVATLYTELYDRVCCKRGTDPGGDYTNSLKVDIAVHMIWDMCSLDAAVMPPEPMPHLVEPAFTVLDTILRRCRTSSCLTSALHGLGHLHEAHPRRVEKLIDRFLVSRQVSEHVREYALEARAGDVQ